MYVDFFSWVGIHLFLMDERHKLYKHLLVAVETVRERCILSIAALLQGRPRRIPPDTEMRGIYFPDMVYDISAGVKDSECIQQCAANGYVLLVKEWSTKAVSSHMACIDILTSVGVHGMVARHLLKRLCQTSEFTSSDAALARTIGFPSWSRGADYGRAEFVDYATARVQLEVLRTAIAGELAACARRPKRPVHFGCGDDDDNDEDAMDAGCDVDDDQSDELGDLVSATKRCKTAG